MNKKGFVQNNSTTDEAVGSKWSLKGLKQVLKNNGINYVPIFKKINEIINKTIMSVEPTIS